MAPAFDITARDPAAGRGPACCAPPTGPCARPAFVPLATKASCAGIEAREVEALGFDMVLGNTSTSGSTRPRARRRVRRPARVHGLGPPIITDSGGFQVFSMGHGNVSDEIKKTASGPGQNAVLGITEEGVSFRNPRNGDHVFMGPETSMEVQAALNSDIALVFDECTPFHVDRDYTARSTERTHRWLDRCLRWHAEHGRPSSSSTGSCRAASTRPARRERETIAGERPAASRSAARSAPTSRRCTRWSTGPTAVLPRSSPRTCSASARSTTSSAASSSASTPSTASPRRAGAATASRSSPSPSKRFRVDLTAARFKTSEEPIEDGCPCPACSAGHSRGYLRYLAKNREQTGQRLLTLHNLVFLARLMRDLREAVAGGTLTEKAAALRAGEPPVHRTRRAAERDGGV
jgi:queuine tRNA-ribosyltransferase